MSSFLLKIFAIITMTIDHAGLILFNNNLILRIIGRIAMPIFAFQVALGFKKTRSKLKYLFRMFVTALISEGALILMLQSANYAHNNLNICFTFTFALFALYFINLGKENKIFLIASIIPILMSLVVPLDYGIYSVSLVLIFYFFGEKKILYTIGMILVALTYFFIKGSSIQLYMLLSLPLLYLYNGKKGPNLKYCFYVFDPLHMLIIALIRFYLNTIKI